MPAGGAAPRRCLQWSVFPSDSSSRVHDEHDGHCIRKPCQKCRYAQWQMRRIDDFRAATVGTCLLVLHRLGLDGHERCSRCRQPGRGARGPPAPSLHRACTNSKAAVLHRALFGFAHALSVVSIPDGSSRHVVSITATAPTDGCRQAACACSWLKDALVPVAESSPMGSLFTVAAALSAAESSPPPATLS